MTHTKCLSRCKICLCY